MDNGDSKSKYRTFRFDKLVRDGIVPSMLANNAKPVYHILDDEKYLEELKRKIVEEVSEMRIEDDDEILKELADLQEAIDCMLITIGKTPEDLHFVQEKKNNKVGSFHTKTYVETVKVLPDNPWIKHYEEEPTRYPEVKNV